MTQADGVKPAPPPPLSPFPSTTHLFARDSSDGSAEKTQCQDRCVNAFCSSTPRKRSDGGLQTFSRR